MSNEYEEQRAFEAEVRRVAEAVWGLLPGECQPEHYSDAQIHELDGIARLRDVTHLIMATVSRSLRKVKEDTVKLGAAEKIEIRRSPAVAKWLITREQLEAEQINHARQNQVKVLTLEQFRRRFFDDASYISKRRAAPFGSARDPESGSVTLDDNAYIELPLYVQGPEGASHNGVSWICQELAVGGQLALLGPFGAGKSLSTREIFRKLSREFQQGRLAKVPLALNLRDHWGQTDPVEVLERHASAIGFAPRDDVVTAWRAGMVLLLLDGFDELAAQVVARGDDIRFMKEARYEALKGIRDLVRESPRGTAILVCGRDHYFDDDQELRRAIGLGPQAKLLHLREFTDEQASRFLRRQNISLPLPNWLPRKPLILGYLASRGLLPEILSIDGSEGFGHAWDSFLNLICEREATHGKAVMDPETLRHVLERLAIQVRANSTGSGPITGRDLAEAYQQETGQPTGEGVLMQLQRLPGLTSRDQDPGARSFVDEDLLAALLGSAVARAILEARRPSEAGGRWLDCLPAAAISMAAFLIAKNGGRAETVLGVARRLGQRDHAAFEGQIAADCLEVAIELATERGTLDCEGLVLQGVTLRSLNFEEVDVTNLQLLDSVIKELVLGDVNSATGVVLKNCLIDRVRGIASAAALPKEICVGCDVAAYEELETNAAVMRSSQPPEMKALLSVLRKVYLQPGGGRKLSALRRGLSGGAVTNSVEPVIQILQSEGLLWESRDIVHPLRRETSRVLAMLNQMSRSEDPVVLRVLALCEK